MEELTIKRVVTIPTYSEGINVLDVLEVGGKIFSKDMIYQKVFEHGIVGVINDIKAEIKKRGGTPDERFDSMLELAENERLARSNGKSKTADKKVISKPGRKKVRRKEKV